MSNACFFYGTLMHPKVLSRVIDGKTSSTSTSTEGADENTSITKGRIYVPAVLADHARHKVRGVDYPAVVPEPGSSVRGVLVENLSDAAVSRLDSFEGDEYERREVHVQTVPAEQLPGASSSSESGARTISCQTYIWLDPAQLLPEEWDFETFERDSLHRWTGERGEGEYEMLHDALTVASSGRPEKVDDGTRGRSAFV